MEKVYQRFSPTESNIYAFKRWWVTPAVRKTVAQAWKFKSFWMHKEILRRLFRLIRDQCLQAIPFAANNVDYDGALLTYHNGEWTFPMKKYMEIRILPLAQLLWYKELPLFSEDGSQNSFITSGIGLFGGSPHLGWGHSGRIILCIPDTKNNSRVVLTKTTHE